MTKPQEKTTNANKARKEKTESEKKCIDRLFEHVRNQHITTNNEAKFTRRVSQSYRHWCLLRKSTIDIHFGFAFLPQASTLRLARRTPKRG